MYPPYLHVHTCSRGNISFWFSSWDHKFIQKFWFIGLLYFETISLIFIRSSIMTAEQSKIQSHHYSFVKWFKRCFLEIFVPPLFKASTQSNSLKNLYFYRISLFFHWFSSWDHNLWRNLLILQSWFLPGSLCHLLFYFIPQFLHVRVFILRFDPVLCSRLKI